MRRLRAHQHHGPAPAYYLNIITTYQQNRHMEKRRPTHPNPFDELFSKDWRVGQQYHVHFVGIIANETLADGIYTLAQLNGFAATFAGCDFVFGAGHCRLYPVNWQELEIQRQESFDRMPVFIPISTLRMRRSLPTTQQSLS